MIRRNLLPIGFMSIIGLLALLVIAQPPHAQSANPADDYPYPSPTTEIIPTAPIDSTLTATASSTETPSETPTTTMTPTMISLITQPTMSADTPVPPDTTNAEPSVNQEPTQPPAELLRCSPNTIHLLSGRTTPDTQLLLKFGPRVVGGGTSDSTGFFAIPLKMGKEPQGDYTIAVITRAKNIIVATLPCVVP